MNPLILRFVPYAALVFIALAGYLYITSLKSDLELSKKNNTILKQNQIQLKQNNKQTIEAYEESIKVLTNKAYQEGLNQAGAKKSKQLANKILKLDEGRKIDENSNTTTYDVVFF